MERSQKSPERFDEEPGTPGAYIRLALEKAEKTQAQLARKLRVSRQFIGAVVAGAAELPEGKAALIENFLQPHFNLLEFEKRVFQKRGSVILDEAQFVREAWLTIKESHGKVLVLTGKPVAFSSENIAALGREFLGKHPDNTMVFIYPDRFETALETVAGKSRVAASLRKIDLDAWSLTTLQDLRRVSDALTEGLPDFRRRVRFLRLPLFEVPRALKTEPLAILKLAQLMHPLTATTLFDGELLDPGKQPFRIGYIFVRNSDHDTETRQHAWLRLSDRFVKTTLELLQELEATPGLLIDETAYAS